MIFKGYKINIKTTLKKVETVSDYSSEEGYKEGLSFPKKEIKKLFFDVHIQVEDEKWNIPYLVTKERLLIRRGLITPKVKAIKQQEKFSYTKKRNLLVPLYSFEERPHVKVLIEILLLLDAGWHNTNLKELYNVREKESFFDKKDFINLGNPYALKYCIRKYIDYAKAPLNHMRISNIWHIPHINLINEISNLEVLHPIIWHNEIVNTHSYNLLPLQYRCSYKNFDLPIQKERFSMEFPKDPVIFKGNFEECFSTLTIPANFNKLIQDTYLKEREERNRQNSASMQELLKNHDYDRDQFDAMTDGQLGNYEDFSGDMDDLQTWSRG